MGLYGSFMFNILRKYQTVFRSSYNILHPHQQSLRIPIASTCFSLGFFPNYTCPSGCEVVSHWVLICTSLMSICPCACWPYVYLIWRNVYLHPLPFLNWVIDFFTYFIYLFIYLFIFGCIGSSLLYACFL